MHLKYNIVNENSAQDVCQSVPHGEGHASLSVGDIDMMAISPNLACFTRLK